MELLQSLVELKVLLGLSSLNSKFTVALQGSSSCVNGNVFLCYYFILWKLLFALFSIAISVL